VPNFQGFPQPKQELRAPQNCFHDAHSDTVTTNLKRFFPPYSHGNSISCNVLSRIRDDLLRRQSMSQKEMYLEIAKPRKPQKLSKASCCTPVGFQRREGKKVPKVSEISSTKQNWEFSAELHQSASETLATVPNTDTLFPPDISTNPYLCLGQISAAPCQCTATGPTSLPTRGSMTRPTSPASQNPQTQMMKSQQNPRQPNTQNGKPTKKTSRSSSRTRTQKKTHKPTTQSRCNRREWKTTDSSAARVRSCYGCTSQHRGVGGHHAGCQCCRHSFLSRSARSKKRMYENNKNKHRRKKQWERKRERKKERPRGSEGKRRGRRQPSTPSFWLSLTS
jgi:hypothetical protein